MLDKFLFGNKHIPEMYFGNIPVAKVYFGNTLIWEKEGFVPYDNTCSIIITGDDTTQKFSVQVMKNEEDVTSSLDHFNGWAYIVNDVLPSYRLFVHNIPYSTVITNPTEISITDLINGCKTAESITDSRYDDTKGEYHIDANQITSKAGGSFPSSKTLPCQNNIVVPYTLTEDTSTNDIWMVVKQNTSNTPIEIKTLKVATTFINSGNTEIYVIHESGICVYKKIIYSNTPSITTKEIGGITYNYVTIDLTGLDTGTISLKRNNKYFIKIKHANNNNNHYYYRNGGILGIVGYTIENINVPYTVYDINSLTYDGVKSDINSMLSVSTANHYAKYTGNILFDSNSVWKCINSFTYKGEKISEVDILNLADGELAYYSGSSGNVCSSNNLYKKNGASVGAEETNNISTIYTDTTSKIFKYTGNDTANIFIKNKFYKCTSPYSNVTEIVSAPDLSSVTQGKKYLLLNNLYESHGFQDAGFYEVTSVSETTYSVSKLNSPVSDETSNMSSKLTAIYRYSSGESSIEYYYTKLVNTSTNLSNLTLSTDHKHEILMRT